MFFIRKGRVVVYATDEMTEIAYLDEGSFFGEIGILFHQNRSVSVRSITASLISTITNQEFKTILKSFPEYRKFIKKIAIQRLETTSIRDIDLTFELSMHCGLDLSDSSSDESYEKDIIEPPMEPITPI